MGKRSNFERRDRDRYFTPIKPVLPLRGHLPECFTFCDPCAGDGRLILHLRDIFGAVCTAAYDIEPAAGWIAKKDAKSLRKNHLRMAQYIVTNPPWTREILHELIGIFSSLAPTWLLFDADWSHTRQAAPFKPMLARVVAVGRVEWIEGSDNTGKDNAAWHLFDARNDGVTQFFGIGESALKGAWA